MSIQQSLKPRGTCAMSGQCPSRTLFSGRGDGGRALRVGAGPGSTLAQRGSGLLTGL